MSFNHIKKAIYALFLTNLYGWRLKKVDDSQMKKKLRLSYTRELLGSLNIEVKVLNAQLLPQDGNYLLVSNHRSVIDPLIVEKLLAPTTIYGHWVSKKELYNSFFFGLFVRNGGSVCLDRESSNMSSFFSDLKVVTKKGESIFMFPEGTRSKGDFKLGEFKDGSRIIAMKNRIDILPIYINTDANEALMNSLKHKQKAIVEVTVGTVIPYKDKTMSLDENYKKQFHIV